METIFRQLCNLSMFGVVERMSGGHTLFGHVSRLWICDQNAHILVVLIFGDAVMHFSLLTNIFLRMVRMNLRTVQ